MEEFDGVIAIVFQNSIPRLYLLIHNQKTGNITFPAGGRNPGETSSKQTLERELLEETGMTPQEYLVIETPVVHEFVYGPKKVERAGQKAKQPVYLVETNKTTLNPLDSDSKIDGWYDSDTVLNRLTFSDSKELFRKVLKNSK
jgi:8-oxo-dGTP pyrophosphatase MutT (NUDIX family)